MQIAEHHLMVMDQVYQILGTLYFRHFKRPLQGYLQINWIGNVQSAFPFIQIVFAKQYLHRKYAAESFSQAAFISPLSIKGRFCDAQF